MSFLLLAIGVFALVAGLVMVGFGVPINEFSFGNTLISAGTTAAVGGLIIIGLGVAVGQLRRIAEMLAFQSHARPGQPMESLEGAARMAPPQGRPAFPQRPKSEMKSEMKPEPTANVEPFPDESAHAAFHVPADDRALQFAAPRLHNPEAPFSIEDDIAMALQPVSAPPPASAEPAARSPVAPPFGAPPPPPSGPPLQARMPQAPKFDAMWPAESKPPLKSPPVSEPRPDAKGDAIPRDNFPSVVRRLEPEMHKPRAVAILKSGVVDGMGYTLYVDGSIEAELPQGTLRFASINELRSHLEKNA